MTTHNDLYCRRQALRLAAQLPDHPNEAKRVIEHMLRLLGFIGGDVEDIDRSRD